MDNNNMSGITYSNVLTFKDDYGVLKQGLDALLEKVYDENDETIKSDDARDLLVDNIMSTMKKLELLKGNR